MYAYLLMAGLEPMIFCETPLPKPFSHQTSLNSLYLQYMQSLYFNT